jgi:hypothetical protein
MKALKLYAKMLIKKLAYEAILNHLKPFALEELKGCKDGQAVAGNVEYNLSTRTAKVYSDEVQAIIDGITAEAKSKVDAIKEQAEKNEQVQITSDKILVAKLPKSSAEGTLSKITDYKKYFAVNA